MSKEKLIDDLKILSSKGKASKRLKLKTNQLITAIKKGDWSLIDEITYVHQQIGGDKGDDYYEDGEFNHNLVGKSLYELYDLIYHGGNNYIFGYKD
jgi:hypothetical protein